MLSRLKDPQALCWNIIWARDPQATSWYYTGFKFPQAGARNLFQVLKLDRIDASKLSKITTLNISGKVPLSKYYIFNMLRYVLCTHM